MSRNWTDAQLAAINTRGKDLLVSAAAGAGKTATLTERIIRSLTDKDAPADISKMLIVTFTRAAASELKQKIFTAITTALAENPTNRHLSEQLVKLGNAKISTIDSFYLDTVKENFSLLGLPPSFRIADTAEADILAKEIMSEVIDTFYDADPDEFAYIAEAFSTIRSAANLPDVFLNLYSQLCSYPEGVEYANLCSQEYETSASLDFFLSSFGSHLKNTTIETIESFIDVLEDSVQTFSPFIDLASSYLPSFSYDLEFCKDLRDKLLGENYESVRKHILSYSPVALKRIEASTLPFDVVMFKDARKDIVESIRKLGQGSFALPAENISLAMKESARITRTVYAVLSDFESRFSAEKLSRGVCDFTDVKRYALKLLVTPDGAPTETAKKLSEIFTDIYIDEYQDVDEVQDLIFSSISNKHNRFMVGDIKQSIYGFRGAEPRVFSEYRAAFPDHRSEAASDSDNAAIFMSNNFRCDENIIKFTNAVCSHLFGIRAESIGYCSDDDLVFSKALPSSEYQSPKVTLAVMTAPEYDDDDDYESNAENNRSSEANYIAHTIKNLIYFGRKADGSRIREGDIAVLYRSGNMIPHLEKAFAEREIKYSGGEDNNYFENPDVLLVLSLLNVIDNPNKDIYLAATLRSPLFDFTLDDLIILRRYCDRSLSLFETVEEYSANEDNPLAQKCREFLDALSEMRDMSISSPTDKLLKYIYASKRFSSTGLATSENLRLLYEYARKFESASFKGLYNFIEYINKLISKNTKFKTAASSDSPDKVRLMTIHSSKGLEFPVCFICGTGGEFNRSEFKDSMLFEHSVGIAMKLPDRTGFARINTPMRHTVAHQISLNQVEEEMRVLYVALTRAREMLYITGSTTKKESRLLEDAEFRSRYVGTHNLLKCKSYLEWILASIHGQDLSDICDLKFIPASLYSDWDLDEASATDADCERFIDDIYSEEEALDDFFLTPLITSFRFNYKYSALSRIPAKISVSRLSPDALDITNDHLNLFDKEKKAVVPSILSGGADQKISSSERGTATHLFLQFCDFERTERTGVTEELARLITEKFIPASAADAVFAEELEGFFESELYKKIKSAKRILREQRFNILLPPSLFSKDAEFIAQIEKFEDEKLAVQGVIDLIVIDADDGIHLYDYKTDRLSAAEMNNDSLLQKKMSDLHAEQLSYYKMAIEKLFGKPCASAEIYSTQAKKLVSI